MNVVCVTLSPGGPAQTQDKAYLEEKHHPAEMLILSFGNALAGGGRVGWGTLALDQWLSLCPHPSPVLCWVGGCLDPSVYSMWDLRASVHCLARGIDTVFEESFPRRAEMGNVIKNTQKSSFPELLPRVKL